MNARFARSLALPGRPAGGRPICPAATDWLDELDIVQAEQQWGNPARNRSADGQTLLLAKCGFGREFGTSAEHLLGFNLEVPADRFTAFVAADDELIQPGNIEFRVVGGGQTPA